MFSVVSVFSRGGGSSAVTTTHDTLDPTVQPPDMEPLLYSPPRHGTSHPRVDIWWLQCGRYASYLNAFLLERYLSLLDSLLDQPSFPLVGNIPYL